MPKISKQEKTTVSTKVQFDFLEKEFKKHQHPSNLDVKRLALLTGLTAENVKAWFDTRHSPTDVSKPNPIESEAAPSNLEKLKNQPKNRQECYRKAKYPPLSSSQFEALEKEFKRNHYMTDLERSHIGPSIGLSPKHVQVWFMNRRHQHNLSPKTPSSAFSSVPSNEALEFPNSEKLKALTETIVMSSALDTSVSISTTDEKIENPTATEESSSASTSSEDNLLQDYEVVESDVPNYDEEFDVEIVH